MYGADAPKELAMFAPIPMEEFLKGTEISVTRDLEHPWGPVSHVVSLRNLRKISAVQLMHLDYLKKLLEDTHATPQAIKKIAGTRALSYIVALTNAKGDSSVAPFVRQVMRASEEVRLIKCADLCDNILHASVNARGLSMEWLTSFFLRIVDPMRKAIVKTKFSTYPKTGAYLCGLTILARAHLAESMRNLKKDGTWSGAT